LFRHKGRCQSQQDTPGIWPGYGESATQRLKANSGKNSFHQPDALGKPAGAKTMFAIRDKCRLGGSVWKLKYSGGCNSPANPANPAHPGRHTAAFDMPFAFVERTDPVDNGVANNHIAPRGTTTIQKKQPKVCCHLRHVCTLICCYFQIG